MTEKEKKTLTREKHPRHVAQGHKLAALMKKSKEGILHNKEQSTEQLQNSPSVQSTIKSTKQFPVQLQNSPSVQSNDTYAYGVSILAVSCHWCLFILYI